MVYPIGGLKVNSETTTVISAAASQRIACPGEFVRFAVGAKALWCKFGDSTVDATAGTAGEFYIPAESVVDVAVQRYATHIAIIQAAATAVGSVTVFA